MKEIIIRLMYLCIPVLYAMSHQPLFGNEYSAPEVIDIWPNVAPGSEDYQEKEVYTNRETSQVADGWVMRVSHPTLTVFPATKKGDSAVVICPGGGYGGLAWDKEGLEIGRWFADLGVTAFVLKYRQGGGPHQHPVPLSDAQRAVRIVRYLTKEFGYQPDQIGVLGFSAGGHLASSVGTHFDGGDASAKDAIDQQSCRPDFLALIYPVISMDAEITHGGSRKNLLGDQPTAEMVELMSNDLQVTDDTPPTFLVHATDDGGVPVENSLRFYRALVEHKVPAELHVFDEGGHGFGMREKELPVKEWPHLLENWLRSRGLIK